MQRSTAEVLDYYNHPQPIYLSTPPIAPTGIELERLLSQPGSSCSLEAFGEALSVRDLIFECEGEGPMAQHPGFPAAVRQVIGSELMKTASREALAGVPCPWGPACGLHVFLNQTQDSNRVNVPPPWVIRSETTSANSMRITLRMFGMGLYWSPDLTEACHRAIEQGIGISGRDPICHSVLIRSQEDVWTGLKDPVPEATQALITFVTPLSVTDDEERSAGQQVLYQLAERANDVARWHGLTLDEDWSGLLEQLEGLTLNDKGLGPIEWNRCLSQKGGANVIMSGKTGLLQIPLEDDTHAALVRLLQIGALLHIGDQVPFGPGRYDLHLMN